MSTRMMSLALATAAAAAFGVAGVGFSTAASAADPHSCEEYAHGAIVQVRGGLNNPRCVPGMQGARWAVEWRVHYDWCLGASYQAIGAERDARTNYLRGCAH
jgi:hypothetical protein